MQAADWTCFWYFIKKYNLQGFKKMTYHISFGNENGIGINIKNKAVLSYLDV